MPASQAGSQDGGAGAGAGADRQTETAALKVLLVGRERRVSGAGSDSQCIDSKLMKGPHT